MCLEEVNRTELIIKDIEREIKRMLKEGREEIGDANSTYKSAV
jgi:hypothetical protein